MSKSENQKFKFFHFFYPETKAFIPRKLKNEIILDLKNLDFNSEKFEAIRKTGENDSKICKLIRNDSIEDFITYLNLNNINYSMPIEQSIFETHPFLIENKLNIIEYACI